MQFKSNWLSSVSIALSTMLSMPACNEKADYSGNETKQPAKDGEEIIKPNNIDAKGESKSTDNAPDDVKKGAEDSRKPEQQADADEANEGALPDLFGKWVMKDTAGKVLATITYNSSTLSRQIGSLKQYDFKITSTDFKDGLIYTVHVEPIMNRDTSRYCIHKVVKEPSSTYVLVHCENGAYPKIDWTQFTAENRYYKVD